MSKSVVVFALLLALLPISAIASDLPDIYQDKSDGVCMESPSDENVILAGRGCCSYHDGECGCDDFTGRTKCCDGTLSPSCRCD
jgi:hypothetical protein